MQHHQFAVKFAIYACCYQQQQFKYW